MVIVDSSVWIEGLRRTGDLQTKLALDALLDAYEALLTTPVRMEVLGGARPEERKALNGWLSVVPYDALPEATWQEAILLGWKLRDAGHTLPWNDVLVAARAIALNVRVYARDKHFVTLAQVDRRLRLYEPGYSGGYSPEEDFPT